MKPLTFMSTSSPLQTSWKCPAPSQGETLCSQMGTSTEHSRTDGSNPPPWGKQEGLGLRHSWGPFALHEPHRQWLRGVKLVNSAQHRSLCCSGTSGSDLRRGPSPLGRFWRRQRQDVTFPSFCLHTWAALNKGFALPAAKAKLFHHLARKPGQEQSWAEHTHVPQAAGRRDTPSPAPGSSPPARSLGRDKRCPELETRFLQAMPLLWGEIQ